MCVLLAFVSAGPLVMVASWPEGASGLVLLALGWWRELGLLVLSGRLVWGRDFGAHPGPTTFVAGVTPGTHRASWHQHTGCLALLLVAGGWPSGVRLVLGSWHRGHLGQQCLGGCLVGGCLGGVVGGRRDRAGTPCGAIWSWLAWPREWRGLCVDGLLGTGVRGDLLAVVRGFDAEACLG